MTTLTDGIHGLVHAADSESYIIWGILTFDLKLPKSNQFITDSNWTTAEKKKKRILQRCSSVIIYTRKEQTPRKHKASDRGYHRHGGRETTSTNNRETWNQSGLILLFHYISKHLQENPTSTRGSARSRNYSNRKHSKLTHWLNTRHNLFNLMNHRTSLFIAGSTDLDPLRDNTINYFRQSALSGCKNLNFMRSNSFVEWKCYST